MASEKKVRIAIVGLGFGAEFIPIYQAHPDVGAILHVHAWMEGIAATDVNYPCGTQELAESVAELIDREPDPAHAVIGLRNHGITATGETLTDILDRIQTDILRQVPMT